MTQRRAKPRMIVAILALGVSTFTACQVADVQAAPRNVVINRYRIAGIQLAQFEAREAKWGVRVPDGTYWYDRVSGAWGIENEQTLGFTMAGMNLGGPMPVIS